MVRTDHLKDPNERRRSGTRSSTSRQPRIPQRAPRPEMAKVIYSTGTRIVKVVSGELYALWHEMNVSTL